MPTGFEHIFSMPATATKRRKKRKQTATPGLGTRRRTAEVDVASIIQSPGRTMAPAVGGGWEPGESGRFRRYARRGLSTEDAMFEETKRKALVESMRRGGAAASPDAVASRVRAAYPSTGSLVAPRLASRVASQKIPPHVTGVGGQSFVPPALAQRMAASPAVGRGGMGARDVVGGGVRRWRAPFEGLAAAESEARYEQTRQETPEERFPRIEEAIRRGGQAGGPPRLATQRMAGKGEVTGLAKHLQDVVAWEAGVGPQPRPYQPEVTAEDVSAMAESEQVATDRWKARQERERAGLVPEELRRRMQTAQAQGRELTPVGAEMEKGIEQAIRSGGKLSPEQMASVYTPQQMAAITEMQRPEAERQQTVIAAITRALGGELDTRTRQKMSKMLVDMIKSGSPGAAPAAEAAAKEPIRVETVSDARRRVETERPEQLEDFEEALAEGDIDKAARIAGLSETEKYLFRKQIGDLGPLERGAESIVGSGIPHKIEQWIRGFF